MEVSKGHHKYPTVFESKLKATPQKLSGLGPIHHVIMSHPSEPFSQLRGRYHCQGIATACQCRCHFSKVLADAGKVVLENMDGFRLLSNSKPCAFFWFTHWLSYTASSIPRVETMRLRDLHETCDRSTEENQVDLHHEMLHAWNTSHHPAQRPPKPNMSRPSKSLQMIIQYTNSSLVWHIQISNCLFIICTL